LLPHSLKPIDKPRTVPNLDAMPINEAFRLLDCRRIVGTNNRFESNEMSVALIRVRTGEGRQRAMARGVAMGRRPKLTIDQRREAIARREAGEILTDIARSYNVSHSTISRLR
jgi:hypothetical protein